MSESDIEQLVTRLSRLITEPLRHGETGLCRETEVTDLLEFVCSIVDRATTLSGASIATLYQISGCWELRELAPAAVNSLLLKLWARAPVLVSPEDSSSTQES